MPARFSILFTFRVPIFGGVLPESLEGENPKSQKVDKIDLPRVGAPSAKGTKNRSLGPEIDWGGREGMDRTRRYRYTTGLWIAVFLVLSVQGNGLRSHALAGEPSGPSGFPGGTFPGEDRSTGSEKKPSPKVLPPAVWFQEEGVPGRNPAFSLMAPDGSQGWSMALVPGVPGLRKNVEREDFYSGAIESGGRLWAGSVQGDLYSIDAGRGRVLWKDVLPGPMFASPVAGPKTIYTVTASPGVTVEHLVLYTRTRRLIRGDGREALWAVSRRTGKIRWTVRFRGGVLSSPMLLPHTVSVVTGRGHLLFLSRADGHMVVDLPVAKGSFGWASPVMGFGKLILAQENPPVYHAISLDAPRQVWRFQLEGTRIWDHFFIGTPLLVGSQLVGVLRRRSPSGDLVVSLSLDTGTLLWKTPFSSGIAEKTEDLSIPTSADGVVYVSSPPARSLMALDLKTGKKIWRITMPESPQNGGTIVGRLLVVGLPSGRIDFVDRKSGRIVSGMKIADSLGPHPLVIVGETIYAAGRDGTVRAMPLYTFGEKVADLAKSPLVPQVAEHSSGSPLTGTGTDVRTPS